MPFRRWSQYRRFADWRLGVKTSELDEDEDVEM